MSTEKRKEMYKNYEKNKRKRDPEKYKAYHKAYREKNRDKQKNDNLFRRFGITLEEYQSLLEAQNGVCKLCGLQETARKNHSQEKRRLAVDHDHNTGAIRGLLCSRCNVNLGHYEKIKDMIPGFQRYLIDQEVQP